jgi:hypothetical protein
MSDRNERLDAILSGEETPSLYAILDEDARVWWYHKELREKGKHRVARDKERRSIREHVRPLREALENGGYATISMSGGKYTISYSDNANISGYGWRLVAAAYLAGIPVLDFRPVESTAAIMAMPMPVIGDCKFKVQDMVDDAKRDGGKPTALSRVLLHDYLNIAEDIGAIIHRRAL